VSHPNRPVPKVSIIMPVHNAGAFIAEAIESVFSQSWQDWELIIIDDASSDNTAQVIGTYTDPRLRYERRERIGSPSGVRNVGLGLAQGEFVGFLDADDAYLPDSLTCRLALFEQNPAINAVYGFASYMNAEGHPLDEGLKLRQDAAGNWLLPQGYSHQWPFLAAGSLSCMLSGLLLRRSFQQTIGLFNEALYSAEDYEYYLRLFLANHDSIVALPRYVYRYRVYPNSLTKVNQNWERILNCALSINQWLFEHPALPADVQACRSMSRAAYYRYFARERLLLGHQSICRAILWRGLQDPTIALADKITRFLPVACRSWLPHALDTLMVRLKRQKSAPKTVSTDL
jgi:glycosyltransferase involved in cell wall biosynthesis